MQEVTATTVEFPSTEAKDVLPEILREGAQTLLAQAIETEVAQWIDSHAQLKDENGHRLVVRNGRLPKREITTGVGQVEIEQPRVHDRRKGGAAETDNGDGAVVTFDQVIADFTGIRVHAAEVLRSADDFAATVDPDYG